MEVSDIPACKNVLGNDSGGAPPGSRLFKAGVVVAFAIAAVALTFFSEKSPFFGGYGSDGIYHGHYAYDLPHALNAQDVPKRLFERIFTIGIIHAALQVTGGLTPPDATTTLENKTLFISRNVVQAYAIYNLALFIFSLLLWHAVISKLRLSDWAYALSFVLLYVNFANFKQYFYEPVMVDSTTFCFGLLTLYVWLNKSPKVLLAVSLFSMVINIASVFLCLALLAFKRQPVGFSPTDNKQARALAACVGGSIGTLCVWNFFVPLCSGFNWENETIRALFPLSLLVIVAVVSYLFYHLFRNVQLLDVQRIFTGFQILPVFIFILSFIGLQWLFAAYAGPRIDYICGEEPYSVFNYALSVFRLAYSRPAGFFAAHFAYFGMTFVFLALSFRQFAEGVKRQGYGALLFAALAVMMVLNTETRHLIFILPFALYFILSERKMAGITGRQFFVLLILALAASKVWLPINPLDATLYPPDEQHFHILYEFPMQRYFMNLGPWMGNKMYVAYLVLFSIVYTGFRLCERAGNSENGIKGA